MLSRDALTIGFARRFATYKRANLLLQDLESLDSLINHPQMPVQMVFAGKSHPLDGPGKTVLQEVARLARDPRFIGKIVFIEDYDINVGRHLVQGVDVWLNNPRRPLEACGTSGQKVVLNGALNLSVLDGWWAEAYDGLNGFAIGLGETHSIRSTSRRARRRQRWRACCATKSIPLYYDRDRDGLPREWIARMKRAIRTLGWRFSADRMVMDYVLKSYIPAAGGTSSDVRGCPVSPWSLVLRAWSVPGPVVLVCPSACGRRTKGRYTQGLRDRGLRKCCRDLFDLLRMPPLVGGHQLDPLIHGHRPEERVIERHLAQGQPVASGQRPREGSNGCSRAPPIRCHIQRARRLRWFRRLSSVHAIAHPLLDGVRQRRTRLRLGRQPRAGGIEGVDDAAAEDAFHESQMLEDLCRRPAVRAGRWRCMAGGMASMAPRSAPRAVSSRDRTSVRWVCMTEGYRRRGFEGKWLRWSRFWSW